MPYFLIPSEHFDSVGRLAVKERQELVVRLSISCRHPRFHLHHPSCGTQWPRTSDLFFGKTFFERAFSICTGYIDIPDEERQNWRSLWVQTRPPGDVGI
jgi:hypothetical protein